MGGDDVRGPIADGPARPDDLDEPEFQRVVGRVIATPPLEVLELMGDAPFPWWLVGGWALELAGCEPREHLDTDVAFLERDLPELRAYLADLDLWAPLPDGMRPILPGTRMSDDETQLWARRSATEPWLMDLLMTPSEGDDWVFKNEPSIRRPLADVTAVSPDGIPYLAPEVALLHKARLDRQKDRRDLESICDRLPVHDRAWLRDAVAILDSDHPWLSLL